MESNVAKSVNSYSHEISADGGYINCRFTVGANLDDAEDWYLGIGRHIEVYNESLVKIWEGFVNKIDLSLGTFSTKRGPLMDVGNRVCISYQTVTYNTNPPIGGDRIISPVVNDTVSQAKYGIIEKALAGGTGTTTEEEQIRDTYLVEFSDPPIGQEIAAGNESSTITVSIECLGYIHFMDVYTFSQTANSGTQNLSAKIEDIITADINSIFSTDFTDIVSNTLQVGEYENDAKTARAIIKGLVSVGDASDNRYTFGIYNGLKASYRAIPTDYEYIHRIADQGQQVFTQSDSLVQPWNIKPARWLFVSDFLIGKVGVLPLRLDPRMVFIESVIFTAPWQVQIVGGKTDKFSQQLNSLGLGNL